MFRTITPIFSIIIGLIVFFYFTKPMFAEVETIQAETTQYVNAAEKARLRNDELTRMVQQKRSYNTQSIERLDALVPVTIDEVNVLTDLSELARKRNMLFGNIEIQDSEGTAGSVRPKEVSTESTSGSRVLYGDLETKDITFSLIGTYEQFKAFLADVERSLVLMEITNIDFMVGEGSLQQYSVTVRLFALPPKVQ